MRSKFTLVAMLAAGSLLLAGCPKKKGGKGTGTGTAKAKPGTGSAKPGTAAAKGPNALPADKAYASGNSKGVSMNLKIEMKVPGLDKGPKFSGVPSTFKQRLVVDDKRGRMVLQTEKVMFPVGTELRYHPGQKKYVLADPGKKKYWVMTGGELGALFEGGPGMQRSGYTVKVEETKEKAKVGDFDAVRSNATISFDYKVKMKDAAKSGKVTVKLAIWHSADKKLNAAWGDLIIDFMSIPFKDAASQNVIATLKKKINFPVKWSMEVTNQSSDKGVAGSKAPTFVTTASDIKVGDVAKADLAYPPAGYAPADGPYSFGKGGQTATPDALGAVPPKKGKPPAKYDKGPGDDKGKKKGG